MRTTEAEIIQILYEMAMSIGDSLELEPMLKNSLSTILRKLNCSLGAIFTRSESNGIVSFDKVYNIPRNPAKNTAYQKALTIISSKGSLDSDISQALPISGVDENDNYFYIMDLPDYGLLLIVRNGSEISPRFLRSLRPINNKMAQACLRCQECSQAGC